MNLVLCQPVLIDYHISYNIQGKSIYRGHHFLFLFLDPLQNYIGYHVDVIQIVSMIGKQSQISSSLVVLSSSLKMSSNFLYQVF